MRSSETKPKHHDLPEEVAYWNFRWAGVPSGLTYRFEADRLVSARYYSLHVTPDINLDWKDFSAHRKHLTEQFGESGTESWVCSQSASSGDQREGVQRIAAGKVVHSVRWTLSDFEVELSVEGKNGRIDWLEAVFSPHPSSEN